MHRSRNSFLVAAGAFLLILPACADAPTEALVPDSPSFASSGPVLIECPVSTDTATTGTIGALGGSVRLQAHELRLQKLAVASPTAFEVRAPVSNYMELTVKANGQNSFEFRNPASITIDYSRCTRENIDHSPLTVWQIDPVTKQLLEPMGGVDDKVARTVTFQTDHLSTFSLAR